MIRVARVEHRVPHRAAGRLSRRTGEVAEPVAGWRREEGDVDVEASLLDGARTPSVAANHHGKLELAVRYCFADLSTDARCVQARDDSLTHGVGDAVVRVAQRTRSERDVPYAHLVEQRECHPDESVAVPQVMMEGDRHAVAESRLLDRFLEAARYLVRRRRGDFSGVERRRPEVLPVEPCARARVGSELSEPLNGRRDLSSDGVLHKILRFHRISTSIPARRASSSVRTACATTGASTMRPSTATTPSPRSSASFAPRTMRSAFRTSFSSGENAS